MADDDKPENGKVLDFNKRKKENDSKKVGRNLAEPVVKRRRVVQLKLSPEDAELLAKAKRLLGSSVDQEVLLIGASVLVQYLELRDNGGHLFLERQGDGVDGLYFMEFDFDFDFDFSE